MRIQRILVGAALLMLCAAAAYAQITVSSIPVTQVITTGRAELAGAVQLTASTAITIADTITIRYGGLPIVNSTTTGVSIDAASTWLCTITGSVDNTNGVVTISCPTTGAGNTFKLIGVRLNMEGFAGTAVSATVGALQNGITAGQNSAVVISSTGVGITASATVGTTQATSNYSQTFIASSKTAIQGWTDGAAVPAVTNVARWAVTEGFTSAWKGLAGDIGPGATQKTEILLTMTGLPSGYTVTVSSDAGMTGKRTSAAPLAFTFTPATFTSTNTQVIVDFTGDDPATVERIGFTFALTFDTTVTTPLPPATYNVTATLYPNQIALTALGALPTSPVFPKFAVANVPSDTGFPAIVVAPASTTFLVPYVTTAAGYDTGISIANTTKDPFGSANGAINQNGAITFTFYPNDGGSAISYTTGAGSPGAGLTSGILNAGSTYVVLVSQILAAAGRTTPFTGYCWAVLSANNGHANAFVSTFDGKFTSASPALVINNPATNSRNIGTAAEQTWQ